MSVYGFDEHRNRLRKLLGREPTWLDVYLQTHLTKESKANYFSGNSEGLRFISETAKEAYEAYTRAILEKYGEDEASQIIDDSELWCDTQLQRQGGKGKNCIHGIGSANAHYVVTGKYSSGSAASSTQSQEEVKNLKEELEAYKVRTKQLEEQMEAFMRRYPPPSPPPNGP